MKSYRITLLRSSICFLCISAATFLSTCEAESFIRPKHLCCLLAEYKYNYKLLAVGYHVVQQSAQNEAFQPYCEYLQMISEQSIFMNSREIRYIMILRFVQHLIPYHNNNAEKNLSRIIWKFIDVLQIRKCIEALICCVSAMKLHPVFPLKNQFFQDKM